MIEKNKIYDVEITGITSEGNGIGRIDNFAIFVPQTAIGDKIKVKILKVMSSFAFGKIEEIVTPSKDRIKLDCENFNRCGGCNFRHINYEAELAVKKQVVDDAFSRLHKLDVKINEIVPSNPQNRYRNKTQLPVGIDSKGALVSGFYANRSHDLIPINDCLIQPVVFNEIASEILKFAEKTQIKEYDEKSKTGCLRHIYIRYGQSFDEIMVCLVVKSKREINSTLLIEQLTSNFAYIKSVIINENKSDTNIILGKQNEVIFGTKTIKDEMSGIKVELSPHSFYQVNKNQAEKLYSIAMDFADLKKDDVLLDLYCGAGTIGLSMAHKVKKVVGVDIIKQSIENAKQNALSNDIKNAEFVCSDANKAKQILADLGICPNIILIDPPRKGCDKEVIDAIADFAPKKVVMISCNPSTAARDCKLLQEKGYFIEQVTPVDMFPRTMHVECVVLLSRGNYSNK
jgi:23S rRNA (uracil1939-C5)-methyltransferase